MPFDDENEPSPKSQKVGLKNVSSQKSIFDEIPAKRTQEELDQKVKSGQERQSGYKIRAAELAKHFNKLLTDKTLSENKNLFQQEIEKELMTKMIQLAIEINNDPVEQEGMGSLGWITLLIKACFYQRDKINKLEYSLFQLEKKIENLVALDSKKTSE